MAGTGRGVAVAAAGVALIGAGVAVATRRRASGAGLTYETGIFANGMAWGLAGTGERSVIVIPGRTESIAARSQRGSGSNTGITMEMRGGCLCGASSCAGASARCRRSQSP